MSTQPPSEPVSDGNPAVGDGGLEADLRVASGIATPRERQWDVLAAIVTGGTMGGLGRYAAGVAIPHAPGTFPWSTLLVNVSGCLLVGVLMIVLLEITEPHRLARPFLGVGVLGGFTTFSTASLEVQQLLDVGRDSLALAYLVATLGGALAAVWTGIVVTRMGERVRIRRSQGAPG